MVQFNAEAFIMLCGSDGERREEAQNDAIGITRGDILRWSVREIRLRFFKT